MYNKPQSSFEKKNPNALIVRSHRQSYFVKDVTCICTWDGIHPGCMGPESPRERHVNVSWVVSTLRCPVPAFVGFATQTKSVRFESAGASAHHTLSFSFNPGVWPAEVCWFNPHLLDNFVGQYVFNLLPSPGMPSPWHAIGVSVYSTGFQKGCAITVHFNDYFTLHKEFLMLNCNFPDWLFLMLRGRMNSKCQ